MSDPNHQYTYLHHSTRDDQTLPFQQLDFSNLIPSFSQNDTSTMLYTYPTMQSMPLDSGYAADEMNPFDKTLCWSNDTSAMDVETYSLKYSPEGSAVPYPQTAPSMSPSSPSLLVPAVTQQVYANYHASAQINLTQGSSTAGHVAQQHTSHGHVNHHRTHSLQGTGFATSPTSYLKDEMPSPNEPKQHLQRPSIKRSLSGDVTDHSSGADSHVVRGRPKQRIPHTTVERRYRENLNAKIKQLQQAVPMLNTTTSTKRSLADMDDGIDLPKPSKCEILTGAVDYITLLELENARLLSVVQRLKLPRTY